MAKKARANLAKQHAAINRQAVSAMVQNFLDLVQIRTLDMVKNNEIGQWDDPEIEADLLSRIKTLAKKSDLDRDNLFTIAALCAVATNFVEEEEEEEEEV